MTYVASLADDFRADACIESEDGQLTTFSSYQHTDNELSCNHMKSTNS
jgi:hypothetical protein